MTDNWYFAQNQQRFGPVPFAQLQQLAASGKLHPRDMVIQQGRQTWQLAEALPELFPKPEPPAPVYDVIDADVQAGFEPILDHIEGESDYDRCRTSARVFVETFQDHPHARPYLPYARYFQWFAEGYRIWQCSYHYTQIQCFYRLAGRFLKEENLRPDGTLTTPHETLTPAFGHLSEMLCEYTMCENALINNDPFALQKRSKAALQHEDQALALLSPLRCTDPLLDRIRTWLVDYLLTNRYLHEGLNACAEISSPILRKSACAADVFQTQIARAEKALESLTPRTMELSSELNAHICHVRRHYQRLHETDTPPTRLHVRKGTLVLTMSAAVRREMARLFIARKDEFQQHITTAFHSRGLEPTDFRLEQLHDIFETSFGEQFLQSLAFDLPDMHVTFLDDREFCFTTSVKLSALGVCTVFFQLNLDECPHMVTVEELRALQALICPHSGQVLVEFCPKAQQQRAPQQRLSGVRFLERLDMPRLATTIERLNDWAKSQIDTASLHAHGVTVAQKLRAVIDKALEDDDDQETIAAELLLACQNLFAEIHQHQQSAPLDEFLQDLCASCASYTQLVDIAQEHLATLEQICWHLAANWRVQLHETDANPLDQIRPYLWLLSPDTGWYCYLSAREINEITADGTIVKQLATFDAIADHPDTPGLILDQREARASFDDWRFVKRSITPERNLAFIRSHTTDALFVSEYQAFLYFPDDPRFLVEQYEGTIELMMHLDTTLKFYNALTSEFGLKVRQRVEEKGQRGLAVILKYEKELREDSREIHWLRSEANEIRDLIMKAGVSRYKDHGDLMNAIVQTMKLDRVVNLLDRHMLHLEEMHQYIIEELRDYQTKLREKQNRWLRIGASLLTLFVAATAIRDVMDVFFQIDQIKALAEAVPGITASGVQGLVTVGLIVLVALGLFFMQRRGVGASDSLL